jgi:hypothetical protein
LGIREKNIEHLSNSNKDNLILCLGGSTTFGHGVDYTETWPHLLSKLIPDTKVVNCGIVKNDLKASLHTLVALLRNDCRPTILVSLDGVNESTGYARWDREHLDYVDFDTNYIAYRDLLFRNKILRRRIKLFIVLFFGDFGFKVLKTFSNAISIQRISQTAKSRKKYSNLFRFHKDTGNTFNHAQFINAAANSYVKSKRTIEAIAKAHGVKQSFFFLQPSFFDVGQSDCLNSRAIYLRELYDAIIALDSGIIDISKKCGTLMTKDMYFDWQHPDGRGNAIIAEEIAEVLRKRYEDSNKIETE